MRRVAYAIGWTPADLWSSTPRELDEAVRAHAWKNTGRDEGDGDGMSSDRYRELMTRYG